MAVAKIKNLIDNSLKSVSTPLDRSSNFQPEVGLTIDYSSYEKQLKVNILGAKNLTKANSYFAKIKFLPGKETFETTTKNWGQWNEDFVFNLRKKKVPDVEIDGSKLITVTLYGITEEKPLLAAITDKKEPEKESNSNKKGSKSNKFLHQFFGKNHDKDGGAAASAASSDYKVKRKIIGCAVIPLDMKNFVSKPVKSKHQSDVSTGEIWRPLKPISSGISGAEDRRENKKGQLEMVLIEEKNEGKLILSISRLRCSLQLMHEQETMKGQLYIKMSVVEGGKASHFWKSDKFSPCVSMKFAQDKAQISADNPYDGALNNVKFVVKFVSKSKTGKKCEIGHFVIGPNVGGTCGEHWREAIAKPGQAITKWQQFE